MASGGLGSLVIRLALDAAEFTRGLTEQEAKAKASADRQKKIFATIGAGLAAGAATAAAGLAVLVKSAIDSAADLEDAAAKTGIAADTLGGLGYAAKLAGGDLESVIGASTKLNKALTEAATGNRDYANAFAALGIKVKDSNGQIKSADKVLIEIAGKFEGYADGAEKAALATQFFSKIGVDQIPLLNDGADAIQANIDLYKKYGGVNNEIAGAAGKFNDTLDKLSLISGAFARTLAAELLPALTSTSNALVEAKEKGDGFQGTARDIATGVKVLSAAVVKTALSFELLRIGTVGYARQAKALATLNISKGIEDAGRIGDETADKLFEARKGFTDFADELRNGPQATNKFDILVQKLGKSIEDEKALLVSRKNQLGKVNEEGLVSQKEYSQRQINAQAESNNAIKKLIDQQIAVRKVQKNFAKGDDAKTIQEEIDALYAQKQAVGTTKPKPPVLVDAAKQAAEQKKLLDAFLKTSERSVSAEADVYASRNKFIDLYNEQNLLSIKDYYAARRAAADENVAATIAEYDKQIAAISKTPVFTPGEAAERDTKILDILDKKKKLTRDAGEEAVAASFKEKKANEDLARSLSEIQAQLLDVNGDSVAAATARINEQYRELRERASVNNDVAGVANVDKLKASQLALAQYNAASADGADIQTRLANAEALAAIARERGTTSELGYLNTVTEARKATVRQLEEVVAKQEAVARASENPALILQAESSRVALERLRAEADVTAQRFNAIFEDGFANAFTDFITGTKSASEAFKAFGATIINQLAQIAAKEAAMALFGASSSGGGLFSSIGGLFGSFGPGIIGAGLATGGAARAGSLHEVAERGPELLSTNGKQYLMMGAQDGVVTPNSGLSSSGASGEKITIINQTRGRIDTVVEQRISPTERALIVQEALDAQANALYDPNSKNSRAVSRNFQTQRSRP